MKRAAQGRCLARGTTPSHLVDNGKLHCSSCSVPRSALLRGRPKKGVGHVHEPGPRYFQVSSSFPVVRGPLAEVQPRGTQGVRLGEGSIVNGLCKGCHGARTCDSHGRHRPLEGPQGDIRRGPQFPVICIVAPVRVSPCGDDGTERDRHLIAVVQHGSEGSPPFIPKAMPYVDGLLIAYLPLRDEALHHRAPQSTQQGADDAQPRCPNGRISLIHTAHHAVSKDANADA